MLFLDLTYPTPAENLACDEALLDLSSKGATDEVLRVWESPAHFVVLGFSGALRRDVRVNACAMRDIPILRRVSGGGTVVQGPGVLNYAVVLRPSGSHEAATVRGAHRFALTKLAAAVTSVTGERPELQGDSDLAIEGKKISGNAQRRKSGSVLVHGTVLLDLDLSVVEDVLPVPDRKPEYRGDRSHTEFIRNLGIDGAALRKALREEWRAAGHAADPPPERIARLVGERYTLDSWTARR